MPSYSPSTGLFYIHGWENAGTINYLGKRSQDTGLTPMGDVKLLPNLRTDAEGYVVVRAFDPKTGEKKWEYKMGSASLLPHRISCSAVAAKDTSSL